MKAVIQRADCASVLIENEKLNKISKGLVILLGVMLEDDETDAEILAKKIAELRIFCDENDKMNLSANDLNLEILVVSNFTLGADCSHGRRPYFSNAKAPNEAKRLYDYFVSCIKKQPVKQVLTGEFGASMKLDITNNGPVTIILDTKTNFK